MTWRPTFIASGPYGETCVRYESPDHPRVYRMVQRDADGHEIDLYYVEGLPAQHWHDVDGAVRARDANP
jgi:hypothetical protein